MVWTPGQLGAFLDVAEHDGLYALFHLTAHRGLRRGESCGLAWTDVELEAARLTVPSTSRAARLGHLRGHTEVRRG